MTPLQKSIAEIEAEITALEAYNEQAQIAGLNRAIQILTANLEYEREEIEKARQSTNDNISILQWMFKNEINYCNKSWHIPYHIAQRTGKSFITTEQLCRLWEQNKNKIWLK